MSSEATPISPTRFAEALKDLSAENLALKVFELRNSIAHLDYSNAELRPYAEGVASVMGGASNPSTTSTTETSTTATPASGSIATQEGEVKGDQDCIDAIAENEVVIARMLQRIDLIKAEVESRGLSWRELSGRLPEADDATVGVVPQSSLDGDSGSSAAAPATGAVGATTTDGPTTNGVNGVSSSDSTMSTATTGGGGGEQEQQQGQRHSAWTDGTFQTGTIRTGGAGLSDEELLRRLQEQIPGMADEDDEGGMHL